MRVLVAEPSAPISNALRKFLEGVADVQVVHFLDEAVQMVRARAPEVLIASVSGSFDGEVLCAQVKRQASDTAVVLCYPVDDAEWAPDRAKEADADAFLVGPLKKHAVLSALRAADRIRTLNLRVKGLELDVMRLKSQPPPPPPVREPTPAPAPKPKLKAGVGVNTADEAFFKKYLLLEVKRSKRYQYPVALLLVQLDKLEEHLKDESSPEFQRAAIRAEALRVIGELLRDIDLAMPFAEDKYLVFLPHTPLKGSAIVAKRIVERLRRIDAFEKGTASVGVASYDPKVLPKGASVSFGKLVREANAALKKAQDAGGDRAEVPEHAEAPKKSRISMG